MFKMLRKMQNKDLMMLCLINCGKIDFYDMKSLSIKLSKVKIKLLDEIIFCFEILYKLREKLITELFDGNIYLLT